MDQGLLDLQEQPEVPVLQGLREQLDQRVPLVQAVHPVPQDYLAVLEVRVQRDRLVLWEAQADPELQAPLGLQEFLVFLEHQEELEQVVRLELEV